MALDNTKQFVLFPNGQIMGGLMYIETGPDTYEPWDGTVDISFGATSLALNDGVDNDIKATVVDFLGSAGEANPLAVVLVDTNGDLYNASGGGGGGAVTIADGADVNAGDTTDAAVTGDNTGTLSAKLRGINKILANVWDSVNSRLNVFIQNSTLAVTQSGSWVISAGSAIIGNVRIDQTTPGTTNGVVVNSSALPSGASTLAEQQTQTTALQIIDDWDETDRAKVNIIVGQAGVAAGTGTDSVTTQRVSLATNIALPAGTNNIGDVDVLSLPAIPTGSNVIGSVTINRTTPGTTNTVAPIAGQDGVAGGAGAVSATVQRVVLATDTTVPNVTGNIAADSADSGNPVKVGGVAFSPDGTAPGTAVTEGDRQNLKTDLNGRLFVNTASPQTVSVHLDGSSAYTDQALFPDPGDGFQVVMTFLQISTGAATALNMFLEEGSTKVWGPIYLEAIAGRGYVSGPINKPFTASTAVTITTSAAIAQSIDATYYIQAV